MRENETSSKRYLCFIDYEKAFVQVQHHKLIELLAKHHIGKYNLQLIQNLYWKTKVAVRLDDD